MKNLLKLLLVSELEDQTVIRPDDNFEPARPYPWKGLIITVGLGFIVGWFVFIPWLVGIVKVHGWLFN